MRRISTSVQNKLFSADQTDDDNTNMTSNLRRKLSFNGSLKSEKLLKTVIGWSGLLYFFFTDNQTWGEAVGLTLFFASGQLQTAMKPPLEEFLPK